MVRKLSVEQVKSCRYFVHALKALQLTTFELYLKPALDMCERLDYCRFVDRGEEYHRPCRHYP